MKPDEIDNEEPVTGETDPNEVPIDDVMDQDDYSLEVSEDDFFGELDEGIDNYFQNLRKKK